MRFHGLDAQVKLLGDLARAFALADGLKYFKLTVTQFFHRGTFRAGAVAGKGFQNVRRNLFADVNFPLSTCRIASISFLPPSCFMM